MNTRAALIASIQQALQSLSGRYARAPGHDLFEGYLLGLVVRAARLEGATVQLVNATHGLLLRTAPGRIYGVSVQGQAYSYAVIQFAQRPDLEAHVGVRVEGKSRVVHECDVLVVHADEAELCRRRRVEPKSAAALISVEGKLYGTPLKIDLGRSFIGLINDLSSDWRCLATNFHRNEVVAALMARNRDRYLFQHVLPAARGEDSIVEFFTNAFRRHRDRRP
jgi:hypothetical protein